MAPTDPRSAPEPAPVGPQAAPAEARLSPLAVTAMVVAVAPCCPFTGLCGTMLALVALRRIRASEGLLRGRKLALWAAVLGILSSFGWMYAWERFARGQQETQETAIVEALDEFVRDAVDGRDDEAIAIWVPEHAPDSAELETFRVAAGRLGAFDRVTVTSVRTGGSLWTPRVEVSLTYRFEGGSALGAARFATRVIPGRWTPTYALERLRLDDPPHEAVELGVAAEGD